MSAPLCLTRKALALASALCALQPAPLLTLEITATSLMGDLTVALVALNALREVGVKFSIDDFGTGYSSLTYLGTLPIDSPEDRPLARDRHARATAEHRDLARRG